MRRKTVASSLVAVLVGAVVASGCSGARSILRGQSPDGEPKAPAPRPRPRPRPQEADKAGAGVKARPEPVAWWDDPRLARVKPRQSDKTVERRSRVLTTVLLAPVAAGVLLLSVLDFSDGPPFALAHHHKRV